MDSIDNLNLAEAEGLHRKVDMQIQELLETKQALYDRIERLRPAAQLSAVAHVMSPSKALPKIGGK